MAGSYVRSVYHCIWSTKHRDNLITDEVESRLWSYLGGIAKNNNMKALQVGGTYNHVHLLLSLPADMNIAKGGQLVKVDF